MNQKKLNGYIKPWQKGQRITAARLDRMATSINANTVGLSGPKQQLAKSDSDTGQGATEDAAPVDALNLNFTEISRTETTTEITDSNGDTHDVNVIDQVIMQNEDGIFLRLNFTN